MDILALFGKAPLGGFQNRLLVRLLGSALLLWGAGMAALCWGAEPPSSLDGNHVPAEQTDFTRLSLEELMSVEITTASKTPEKLRQVPSAVFVITHEDIRRSGVRSIPEALRMAPGVQVARISPTEWAITIRGLNQEFSNNLLVLIDGRSVYSPVFSGVFWDIQDLLLEDIARIEVIRGPGAAVWGANAVNGVINIITQQAQETQGGLVKTTVGTHETSGAIRYGGEFNPETAYRAYVKYFLRDNYDTPATKTNYNPADDWRSFRTGFRLDREYSKGADLFTFEGEAYVNRYQTRIRNFSRQSPYYTLRPKISEAGGGHVLGRWKHWVSVDSDTVFQVYFDRSERDYDPGYGVVETLDADFRHRFQWGRQAIIWGLGYRFISDRFTVSGDYQLLIDMKPEEREYELFSAFVQDRITLLPQQLWLTLGSKFEHNDFTGAEVQPSMRILWNPSGNQVFWAAVSRAVRIPSRMESDVKGIDAWTPPGDVKIITQAGLPPHSPPDLPLTVEVRGNADLDAETLFAYELGYRNQISSKLWVDAAVFYHEYDDLIVLDPARPFLASDGRYVLPQYYENDLEGRVYGFELAADWQPFDFWRLQGSYGYLETRLRAKEGFMADWEYQDKGLALKSEPKHQLSLRSGLDIGKTWSMDLWLRYVDSLSENDIAAYTTLDGRLAWHPDESIEIALIGQSLLEDRHTEFSCFEVERSLYLTLAWEF